LKTVQIEEFMQNRNQYQPVDVRSPGEYRQAHIPGAINVPLFTDEERAIIGITYKNEGIAKAKLLGLKLVAPRLPEMVEQILAAAGKKKILVYCWRGGMRSYSMCALMDALRYPVFQLNGGYKAFRRFIFRFHQEKQITVPVFVLNGLTGVGKTAILQILQSRGHGVLDLEGMANHRGSVFGSVGLGAARSQKDFEALLAYALLDYEDAPYLIIEGEGRRIGHVRLPDYLYTAMLQGAHILVEADLSVRVERIVNEYHGHKDTKEELMAAVSMLQKKLGKAKIQELTEKIRQDRYHEVVLQLCRDYYDQYYGDSKKRREEYLAVIDANNLQEAADDIILTIEKYLAEKTNLASAGEAPKCM